MKGSNEIKLSWALLGAAAVMACYYMVSFEAEQRKAETLQIREIIVQPDYLACVDEIAAQQSLIVSDANILVDAGKCFPTEEIKGNPTEILAEFNQFYFVRASLPDDITAEIWIPKDAAK